MDVRQMERDCRQVIVDLLSPDPSETVLMVFERFTPGFVYFWYSGAWIVFTDLLSVSDSR